MVNIFNQSCIDTTRSEIKNPIETKIQVIKFLIQEKLVNIFNLILNYFDYYSDFILSGQENSLCK